MDVIEDLIEGGESNVVNPDRRPLDRDEVEAILEQEIQDSIGFVGSEISEQRRKSLQYYYGRPFGNETEGRSKVVLSDVLETIEWILPSLMRIFFGSHRIVRYVETTPEHEAMAKQANKVVPHIVLNECNGFLEFHNWFKTALIEKNSYLAVYAEEIDKRCIEFYQGLTEAELAKLFEAPNVEVVEGNAGDPVQRPIGEDPETGELLFEEIPTFDVKVRVKQSGPQIKLEGAAPEEIIVSRRAMGLKLQDIPFVGRRFRRTFSDLLEMGVPEEVIDDLPTDHSPEYEQGRTERRDDEEDFPTSSAERSDWASRELWLTECFIRIDEDGDGYAELRKILVAGATNVKVVLDEEIDETSIYTITPIPMPYKHFGLSIADIVMDLQEIRSTLLRQMLDNLYLTNNSRVAALEGEVELDDLLTSRPGGVVRVRSKGAVEPLNVQPLGPMAFNMLEYLQGVRENRTGVTRYNQGTDADSLNQTARGITEIMNAAQMRIDLIARIFAETGIKDVFAQLYKLAKRVIPKGKKYKISGEWVEVDPDAWPDEMDVQIEVGLGTGQSLQRQDFLGMLIELQRQIAERHPEMVSRENVYNAASKLTEEAGFTVEGLFFTDPASVEPPEPPPDPEMVKIEQQAQQAAAELELKQTEGQAKTLSDVEQAKIRRLEVESRHEAEMARIELERERVAIDRQKLALEEERLDFDRAQAARETKEKNDGNGADDAR